MRRGSGTPLILAGRNAVTLAALAAHLGVEYRVFALDDAVAIDRWAMSAPCSIAQARLLSPPMS